jgi:hypothetical protein
MSGPGAGYTDDLREFYFSNPADAVAVDTLEFRHQAFDQPARVCNDQAGEDFVGTLEESAPANAGEAVTFTAARFEVTLPESNSPGLPTCQISVENVGRVLMDPINQAVQVPSPISVTYRQFLADDPSEPGIVFDGLTIRSINASALRVTAQAGFEDDLNTPFGRKKYTPQEYPGLVR